MKKKTIIITGASDGIGAAAARKLAANGHNIVIVGRSPIKTERIAKELKVPFYVCDYSDLSQVRTLAISLGKEVPHIDVLVHNAGGMFGNRHVTEDGMELSFQVNHIAPFLLTNILLPVLKKSHTSVIATSSIAHKLFADFDIDDLQLEDGYNARKAYGNVKLMNIMFVRELHRRYNREGISAAAFHSGIVATNFANSSNSLMHYLYHTVLSKLLKSPEEGAATMVWLSENDPGDNWESGGYYENCKKRRPSEDARNDILAEGLWRQSEKLLSVNSNKNVN